MIVESMSYQEVIDEYKKDFPEMLSKIIALKNYNWDKEHRLMVKKKPKTPQIFFSANSKSKNNNNYILEAFTYSYAYWKKEGRLLNIVLDFQYQGGRNLLCNAYGDTSYYWIGSNFIQEYKDRFLHNDDSNAGVTFLHRNPTAVDFNFICGEYKGLSFTYVNDGIVLGHYVCPNVFYFGTFLNRDMLIGDEIDLSNMLSKNYEAFLKDDCKINISDIDIKNQQV